MIQAPPFLGEQHAPFCVCSYCAPYGTREARRLHIMRLDIATLITDMQTGKVRSLCDIQDQLAYIAGDEE